MTRWVRGVYNLVMVTDPVSILIAVLVGIGSFTIVYWASRLALKDHDEDKAQKKQGGYRDR